MICPTFLGRSSRGKDKVFKEDTWICNTCNGLIENVKEGWVEWVELPEEKDGLKGRDLRLVHAGRRSSQFNEEFELKRDGGSISDLPLDYFLGPHGFLRLLLMISDREVTTEQVLEMIKKLTVLGFEHARIFFKRAISSGVFEPEMPVGYFSPENINETLKYAESILQDGK